MQWSYSKLGNFLSIKSQFALSRQHRKFCTYYLLTALQLEGCPRFVQLMNYFNCLLP